MAQADLEGVIARLAARHRLEREGGVYAPNPFSRPASVAIVSIGGEDGALLTESPLVFVAALALCLAGALLFALAGVTLLRDRARSA